jgi:hypothetical protein
MQKLIDDPVLRIIAQVVLLALFVLPSLVWLAADIVMAFRENGYVPPFALPLFSFLKAPFSTNLASFGFILVVVIPGLVSTICFQIDKTATPWVAKADLNRAGLAIVILSIIGLVVGFVSLALIILLPEIVDDLSDVGLTAIQGLASSTVAFYGVYLVQLLGLQPK